ncbi:alpha/beta hydrolase family protein [Flavitalea flava]
MLVLVFYVSSAMGRISQVQSPEQIKAGKITDTVTCKADPTQSYALYIPAKITKEPLPVIYFFDPHANGAIPLTKYKSLADEYGFIFIGSNNSKNGNDWATSEIIWRRMFDDTKNRWPINPGRIYTCGFSGGAKVAGYIALQHPDVKGVIANGAGLPDGTTPADFHFSFTAIAGEGDLNLTDLVAISKALDKTRTRHHLILFDGKHEWAPLNTMNTAIAGLQLDAMRQKAIPGSEAFINRYIEKSKKKLEIYSPMNQLVKAGREYKLSISFLDGLTPQAGWFEIKLASLINNSLYRKQLQTEENILVTEQNTKAGYMRQFQQSDRQYWLKTIDELQTGSHAKTAQSAMNERLLAYLSLAFYSYSNHFINSNSNNEAGYFTDLYKIADSSNNEAWYFSAILHARGKQAKAAENDLLKAVKYGFRDKDRLMQQPEFQLLAAQINLSGITNHMRGSAKK